VAAELKFAIFQAVIILPFITGYLIKNRLSRPDKTEKSLIRFNLACLEPPVVLWSIWGLTLSSEMIFLPVAGLCLVVSGFIIGKASVRAIHPPGKDAETFIISSSLANHGFTMGGFLCYLFAGETGLALSAIFLTYFIPYTFLFIFTYAGTKGRNRAFDRSFVRDMLFSLRNMPLYAAFVAVSIRLAGIVRPDIYFPVDLFLIVSIGLYYFTLGINFKIDDLNFFKREHGFLAAQKFIILPAAAFFILHLTHLSPEIKMVIKLESFMPAAIYSVITAIIFDLNARHASSLFVVNSLLFIFIVFPLLFFGRGFLF